VYKVWDGTEWSSVKALKVWNGTTFNAGYKFKVRTSTSWLPTSVSDKDDSQIVKWSVEGPTPPPPPPPITHPVPDLDLLTLLQVEEALDPLSFTYSVSEYEVTTIQNRDDRVVIDSQIPEANQQLAEGSNVVFKLYNFVQPTTTVPDLDDLLVSQANLAITNANLVVSTNIGTDETYDNNKIGRVIVGSQYPTKNSVVDTGTEVTYDKWVQKPFATVPNIVNLNDSQVFGILDAATLNIGTRTVVATSNAALDDKVKSQYPAENTQVQQDSNVNYEVYEHSLRVVPNLNNQTAQDASQMLLNVDLRPGTITNEETTVVANEGKVKPNSQSHPAGFEVNVNTQINFTVFVANTTTTVPNVVNLVSTAIDSAIIAAELQPSLRNITYTQNSSLFYKCYAQSPSHPTVVPVGSIVQYDMYLQEPQHTVPSIIGQTPSSGAINTNFTWGSNSLSGTGTEDVNSFGKVATQSPAANGQAYAGAINYGVFTDSRPTVPNVVEQQQSTAQNLILGANLNYTVTYQALTSLSQNYLAGTVASQNPPGGTKLGTGQYVTIVVYTAYVAQPVTQTGYVTVGYGGNVPMLWQASYRDTLGTVAGVTNGGRLTTTQPFYFGQFSTTNGKQHHAFHYDWNTFDTKAKQVSGNAAYTITNVELKYYLNDGIGNTNAKSLRIGSYPNSVSSSPTTMTEADVYTIDQVLSAYTRGIYAYADLNSTLLIDIFTFPNYPCVIYAPNTSINNYGSNNADVLFTVTIQWTANI